MSPEEEIAQLRAENASLKETVRQLRERLNKNTTSNRSRSWRDDYDYLPYEEDDRS